MKNGYSLHLILFLFLFVFITSCKEEAPVEQNQIEPSPTQSILLKDHDLSIVLSDSTIQKLKKDKIYRLKKEHEKPYVVLEKPEKLLEDFLKNRNVSKSLFKSQGNSTDNSIQSTQSCYTIQSDVWVLLKYHPITNKIVGIWPKQDGNWAYNNNTLSSLKNIYGYSKILLEKGAIDNETVYGAPNILAGGNGCDPNGVSSSYSSWDTATRGSFWGLNTNEPITDQGYSPNAAQGLLTLTKNWWKQKFGSSSKIVVGETNQFDASYFSGIADFINCTRYTRYSWGIADQTGLWDQFNNYFNTYFNHLWISGDADYDEIDHLIGYAKVMPKNSIWLYAGESNVNDTHYWNAVTRFSYYSYVHNYLQREEKRFIYVWSYIGNGDPCSDYQITSWELTDIIETSDTRIL